MKIMLSKQAMYSHLGLMVWHEMVIEGDRLLAGKQLRIQSYIPRYYSD